MCLLDNRVVGSRQDYDRKDFFNKLKKNDPATVFLDGDTLRQVFGDDLGYSETDRRKCAMRYSRLCKFLFGTGNNDCYLYDLNV